MRGIQYLHPDLQRLVKQFVAECLKKGLPVLVTETWRTKEEQNNFWAQGRTRPGVIVTNATYPYSPHCWGVAFDFCRNVKGREYDNSDGFFDRVGRIAEKMFDNTEFDLFWGGDWKNFVDKPHVEMKKYMPNGNTDWLVKTYGNPEAFKKTWNSQAPKEEYTVEQIKVLINGKVTIVDVIVQNGQNYVKLRNLESDKIKVGYENKMPTITTL